MPVSDLAVPAKFLVYSCTYRTRLQILWVPLHLSRLKANPMIHEPFWTVRRDDTLHPSRFDVASLSTRRRIAHAEALQHSAKLRFQLL
jgi:hypothetical protein